MKCQMTVHEIQKGDTLYKLAKHETSPIAQHCEKRLQRAKRVRRYSIFEKSGTFRSVCVIIV